MTPTSLSDAKKMKAKWSFAERRRSARKSRKQLGVTLDELAKLCQLSMSTLSRFESGDRDLSAKAYARLFDTLLDKTVDRKVTALRIEDVEKKAVAKLAALGRTVPLNSLLRQQEIDTLPPSAYPMDAVRTALDLGKAQERIHQLEALHADDQRMIEGYRKLHETDLQIIRLLQETGPGSAAMDGVHALEEIERLRAENAELRSWLNAEEVAAVAHAHAAELRDQLAEKVSSEQGGEE